MKAKPFEPGEKVGAYIVKELLLLGRVVDETLYACTATCCGSDVQMRHVILADGRRQGRTRCRSCAMREVLQGNRNRVSRLIGQKFGFYTIQAALEGNLYQVRRRCCGVIEKKNYKQLYHAQRENHQRCNECRLKGIQSADAPLTGLSGLGLTSAADAWPRPRSLAA